MSRKKVKSDEKRKRVMLAMRPDVHAKLKSIAKKQYLSMSRLVEFLIINSEVDC
jgi:hypothetical protein